MIRFILLVLVLGVAAGGHRDVKKLNENGVEKQLVGICQGRRIQLKKIPFMASLKVNGVLFGAGVVLNNWWIMTSAFNVKWFDPSELEFRVKSPQYNKGGQVLSVDQVVCHDLYNGSWDYNIALVKTKKEIKANAVSLGAGELQAGTVATIAGWGSTEPSSSEPSQYLLSAGLTMLDWKLCNETYSPDLSSRMLCTKYEDVGPCGEDFGDPLLYKNAMYGFYAGKLYGYSPRLYTNVTAYADWIQSIISS